MIQIRHFFYIDNLTLLMMGLVSFVGLCIASFSIKYLKGDSQQKEFFKNFIVLISSVFIMISADNVVIFLISWGVSNSFLVRLMIHKNEWSAAQASANLAFKNFLLGFLFLGLGFLGLFYATGHTSIQLILKTAINPTPLFMSTLFIFLAGMTQSALWPFHKWLISSLNSPTPVSALMHAGLINGGGFLLIRFAPLYLKQPAMLHIIFITGIITTLLGTLWKLMQHDIKRMLACSTMGQMGFMMAQCGLGLFGAALAHLIWHGLFKAYLFLGVDDTAAQELIPLYYPPRLKNFIIAFLYGLGTAYLFCIITGKNFLATNTVLFLTLLVTFTGAQFVLPLLQSKQPFKYLLSLCAAISIGIIYGFSIKIIYTVVTPLNLTQPQPFTYIYSFGLLLLSNAWLLMLFGRHMSSYKKNWMLKWYVYMLNASQPDKKTITTHRNDYRYKGGENE